MHSVVAMTTLYEDVASWSYQGKLFVCQTYIDDTKPLHRICVLQNIVKENVSKFIRKWSRNDNII